jgi:phosphoglycerol transferase MdoB-like AlkP superfamily enzyme
LTQLAERALIFDNAYCAYPESIKGLHSMLCSAHPRPYLNVSEYVSQKLACTSVTELLAKNGYRTAFFHSGQFRYLGMRGIVEGRGFHELYDAETIGGKFESSFGTDDASTADRLLAFVDSLAKDQRFFAVYSPIAGHHPYRTPGPRATPFPAKTEFDHYRNDLYTGDLAFGRIVDGIEKRGLSQRTLWVIVGDHGEAFEQHPGNVAHTLYVYDENLHVPFIIAAPGLTTSRIRVPQIASLIDMAPTTLELLGLGAPRNYEGRALIDPIAGSAVSFTDHDLLKASVRHGPWKFIYESEHERSRLFNLERDPREQHDVSGTERATSDVYRKWLLGWLKAKGSGG